MHFSKSRYTQGIQCPKILWMKENMPDQFDDSVMNQAILETGNNVGDVAMGYFGSFVEVDFDPTDPDRYTKAAKQTQEYLDQGQPIICEATFTMPGHFCMVDILKVRDDGAFGIIEVKSSTGFKDIYAHDMAYQTWLIQSCGYEVNSVSLMHINKKYVRHGALDLSSLFTIEDHTDEVFEMVERVPDHLGYIGSVADESMEPPIPIGLQCFQPYECGFKHWCFSHLPDNNVFDLHRMKKLKAFRLVERGLAGFDDLLADPAEFSGLTAKQQLQILTEANDLAPQIDRGAIAEFLGQLTYPLYFLDFETYQEAIPSFDDQSPYEQITSQYSLHWLESPGAELKHAEFLGKASTDTRRAVAEQLCKDIPADACVLAWNMSFEKGCIKAMADLCSDLSEHLMSIYRNIKDLMVPFRQQSYYCKEMQGSSSIKKVLPALFPDDDGLDYHALEGVHNGSEASDAFLNLSKLPNDEQALVREQLLRYCELDTLAMVRIWEKLEEVVAQPSN